MSDATPWWLERKEQSLKRKAQESAANAEAQAGDSFLIVTEGTVTEPVYMELLRADLQLSAVKICIIPGVHSDPRHVVTTAAKEVEELARRARRKRLSNTELEKYDHVWAVIDTDVAQRHGFWPEVEALASKHKIKLAHSSPCFEFWLLLHLQYTTAPLENGDAAKSAVRHAVGCDYSTNAATAREAMPRFIPDWPKAVVNGDRVREHHAKAGTPIPANPSTEVCRLVRALNDSAPQHLRKL